MPLSPSPNRRILLVEGLQSVQDRFRKILTPARSIGTADETDAQRMRAKFLLTGSEKSLDALVQLRAALSAGHPFALAFMDLQALSESGCLVAIKAMLETDPRLQVVICTDQVSTSMGQALTCLDTSDRLLILKKPFADIEVMLLASSLCAKWQACEDALASTRQLEAAVAQRTNALRASMDFSVAVFDSMAAEIAVLDRHGVITLCNQPWCEFARQNGTSSKNDSALTGVGVNYLEICRAAAKSAPDSDASEVSLGIQAVLDGTLASYSHEYPCHSAQQARWFGMRVTPLGIEGGGAVVAHVDLTEQKHTESALRASQSFLDKTGRIGGVGGWEIDIATHAVQWTAATCRLHDLPPGQVPTFEEGIRYYAPEARPVVEQAIRRCMETGEGFDLELPLTTAAGRTIWVRAVGEAERVCGEVVRLVGAFQDVSARRALEAELRQKNDLLGTVLANLPCGLSVFDSALNVVLANSTYRGIFDLPDELFNGGGLRFEDLLRLEAKRGELDQFETEATVQAILGHARESTPRLFELKRPDGTLLEVRSCRLPDGGLVATYIDITPRRRAEQEARRSTELLRGAIEAIDEAFVLYDPRDRLVFCNEKYRGIYATSADLIVPGARFEDIVRGGAERGQYPEAKGRIDAWVQERVAAHARGAGTVVQKIDDGRTLRIVERRMPDGHLVGFRIDISDLMRATEAAQAASLAKSQFLANMSHELRTPMNAILGMLTLLRRTPLTTRQADYAAKSESAARSLLRLLNEILDFSKVEAGKMTLEVQPFDIDHLLGELAQLASVSLGSKPIELMLDIDVALPTILTGDAMRLKQVLLNLMGNAIKFTSFGEVVAEIRVIARSADKVTIDFSVSDTGIGIDPASQTRIFSGFSQAEASITRRFGGTGLGLAISRQLVGLMGGELRVESAPGRGSRFHFRIDLSIPTQGESDALCATSPADHAKLPLHALYVDDHARSREALSKIGARLNWQTETASSGIQALEMLEARHADEPLLDAIIVVDDMQKLDGWETIRCIRAQRLQPHAVMLLLTSANGQEQMAQRAEVDMALIDGFLLKPVTATALVDAMRQARTRPRQSHLPAEEPREPERRLEGMCLLVAEDNPTNQQVARELLVAEGASVHVVQNGSEAVDAVRLAPEDFDAVLMDLQMPVMDGFTATRQIRSELKLGLSELPIVAMTANAMSSDRQACLAAGMNDHVGKPFDLTHLVGVLRKHAGRKPVMRAALDTSPPPLPTRVLASATTSGIEMQPAVQRLGGRLEVYQCMLQGFAAELPVTCALLSSHIAAQSTDAALQLLHTLKGLAATLGVTALSVAAQLAEKSLREAVEHGNGPLNRKGADSSPDNSEMLLAWKSCKAVVKAISQTTPGMLKLLEVMDLERGHERSAPPHVVSPELDIAALQDGVAELATLLRDGDMGAIGTMDTIQQDFGPTLGRRLSPMADAVARLDFHLALQRIEEFMPSGVSLYRTDPQSEHEFQVQINQNIHNT